MERPPRPALAVPAPGAARRRGPGWPALGGVLRRVRGDAEAGRSGLQAGPRRGAQASARLGTRESPPGRSVGDAERKLEARTRRRERAFPGLRLRNDRPGREPGRRRWEPGSAPTPRYRPRRPRGSGLLGRSPGLPRSHRQSGRSGWGAGEISKNREEPPLLPTPPSQDTLGATQRSLPRASLTGRGGQLHFSRLTPVLEAQRAAFRKAGKLGEGSGVDAGERGAPHAPTHPPIYPGIFVQNARMLRANVQSTDLLQKSTDFSRT